MHRWSKQKIGKETLDLNYTLNEMKLTDINSTFYPTAAKYTFFSSAQRIITKIVHILGHKTSFNAFKFIQVIKCLGNSQEVGN